MPRVGIDLLAKPDVQIWESQHVGFHARIASKLLALEASEPVTASHGQCSGYSTLTEFKEKSRAHDCPNFLHRLPAPRARTCSWDLDR